MERYRKVEYAERIYSTLLLLYPVRFRRRFGCEMTRVFRECCYEQLQTDVSRGWVTLWLHTLKDLVVSAGQQRIRELIARADREHPVFGIIDSTLVPSIIVANLIALGAVVTILFLRGAPGHGVSAKPAQRRLRNPARIPAGARPGFSAGGRIQLWRHDGDRSAGF